MGIMLFDFFGNLYEIQSIKTPLFNILNAWLNSKSYKIRLICTNQKIQEIYHHWTVEMDI